MKKIIATALFLLLALIFTGCTTEPDINADEYRTVSSDLEASLSSMQAEISALNEKLEQSSSSTSSTATTTTAKPTTTTTTTTTTTIPTTTATSTTTTTTKPLPVMPNVIGMTVADAYRAILDAGIGYKLCGYPSDYIVTSVTPTVGTQIQPHSHIAEITAEPPQQ